MEHSPAQNVNVQMENGLARPQSIIDDHPVTLRVYLTLTSQLGGNHKKVSHERAIFSLGFFERGQMLARNNQKMNRRLGVYVFKSQYGVVFENDIRRRLAVNDAAKNTVFQGFLPEFRGS